MMPAISAGLRFIAALSEAPRTRGRPGQHPALRWTELSDRLGVRDPPFEPVSNSVFPFSLVARGIDLTVCRRALNDFRVIEWLTMPEDEPKWRRRKEARPALRGRHQTSRGAGDRNVSVEQRY
jgi:hypothetical protein